MSKDEMDAAILKSFDECWGSSDRTMLRAAFIAGMLAAAELPGNPNALQRDTIRVAARKLKEPTEQGIRGLEGCGEGGAV